MFKTQTINSYLTIEDVIKILKISRSTAYGFIWSGKLKHHRIGRLIRISSQDLDRFVEGRPHTR